MEEIKWIAENISILGNKWAIAVLMIIFLHEVSRFGQIKKRLKMNSKTLSQKLDMLVTIGLVKKIDSQKRAYEYLLTDMGKIFCLNLLEINKLFMWSK